MNQTQHLPPIADEFEESIIKINEKNRVRKWDHHKARDSPVKRRRRLYPPRFLVDTILAVSRGRKKSSSGGDTGATNMER